jgi:regulator of sigma E protease
MAIFLLIVGLILFVGLVVVHEWGHFTAARRNGVEVEEFGIGFPPRALLRRIKSPKGDYDLTLNWLPLGGFVRLKGEHDSATAKGSFGVASLSTKVKIMLAGVVMNLATALVLLTLVALVGMPKLLADQFTVDRDTKVIRQDVLVGMVEPGSPAEKAGLQTRDHLISLGPAGQEQRITEPEKLPDLTKQYSGQSVNVTYQRDGQEHIATAQLRGEEVDKDGQPKGRLGVSPAGYTVRRSTWSAPVVAVGVAKQFTVGTLQGLGSAIANLFRGETGKATEQVAGPVGIFVVLRDGSLLGYQFILLIIAVISLTLAIMNVLPIPALDGGRLFVTLAFHAVRRPLNKKTEEMIHGTGFAALMILFVLITIVDVRRFF